MQPHPELLLTQVIFCTPTQTDAHRSVSKQQTHMYWQTRTFPDTQTHTHTHTRFPIGTNALLGACGSSSVSVHRIKLLSLDIPTYTFTYSN